jgi:hypothetical protein
MLKKLTREEFDLLPSNINFEWSDPKNRRACPDCGSFQTHPTPGCACPGHPHIMKYHHTCQN